MNTKKIFSTFALILGSLMITATTYAAGITYEGLFDPRTATAPVEGKIVNEALNYESFFDRNVVMAPSKGIKLDAQSPMICWGGAECLIH